MSMKQTVINALNLQLFEKSSVVVVKIAEGLGITERQETKKMLLFKVNWCMHTS